MAKQHPRDFAFGQWFMVIAPSVVGIVVALFSPHGLEQPSERLYLVGGGIGLSLLVLFLNVYGEDL